MTKIGHIEMTPNHLTTLAYITHAANRAFRLSTGERNIPRWDDVDEAVRDSARDGVKEILDNPDITAKDIHDNWVKFKASEGWVYGPDRDDEKKTHPCLVDYDLLPPAEQYKDYLFISIVKSYISFLLEKQESLLPKDEDD